ncbi:MAG: PQQ-dependent sugar dehydrogenase [Bacteroidota bacterium]
MRFSRLAALLVGAAALTVSGAHAQDLTSAARLGASAQAVPDGFYLEDAVDASFVQPVAVAFAPGGRMFVVEKRGLVHVVVDGVLQAEPFLDIQDEVLNSHDRGLLGIAVDPDFETNRRVYLSYTVDHNATTDVRRLDAYARVTRWAGKASNPNEADLSTRQVLIGETFATGIPSCYYSHTIGTLAFGSDGSLFVGTGEGAHYGRVDDGGEYDVCFRPGRLDASEDIGAFRSQRLESLAGKILRVDPETGDGYASNPFYTGDASETASKVWALGLRNPFRFAILADGSADPEAGAPGTLYIGDVGWGTWEEINVSRGGENFGWPCYEGPNPHTGYQNATPPTNGCQTTLAGTLSNGESYLWHHSRTDRSVPQGRTGRAVMVGTVYEGRRYPDAYDGALFYGDYPNGWLASARVDGGADPTQERLFDAAAGPLVDAAHDVEGDYLVLVNVATGRIQRVRHVDEAANAAPVASAAALPAQGAVGVRVQFSPEGSFDPDGDTLSYAWDFGDGTTSAERAPLHVYAEAGVYTASVSVSDAFATTRKQVTVTVQPGGAPTIRILSPTRDARAIAGESFPLRAAISDPDQAASTLSVQWRVTQVHENHLHPDVFLGAGEETAFVAEEHGEDGELYYYRLTASVRDATGLTAIDESVLFLTDADGIQDVTDRGTAFAVAPGGTGLERIADGEMPAAGSGVDLQFDSGAAPGRTEAGVGYAFAEPLRFTGLTFQEGLFSPSGGWFETLGVQVRVGGAWRDVVGLMAAPAYAAHNDRAYDTHTFRFVPTEGDAIRLVGRPGGGDAFVTVGELRAFAVEAGGPGPLPAPWASTDVGTPAAAGAASVTGGAISVTGGGDLWGAQDRMHLAHQPLAGNGVLTARLTALSPSPDWAKAALVVRAGPEAGAPYVGLAVSNLGTHFQVRSEADADTDGPTDLFGRRAPTWLRLERIGTTVTASVSDDGQAWSVVDAATVPALDGEVLVGMAVSAADYGAGASATAAFRDVTLTAALPTPWASADVGAPAGTGEAVATDPDGSAFDVTGGGDTWGSQDRMHMVSQPLDGDGSVVARVASLDAPATWAKAGLVIRGGPEAGAPYAGVVLSTLGVHLQVRTATDAPTAGPLDVWGVSGPVWLRLDRVGTEVAAFWSADGADWQAIGTVDVPALPASAIAGLVVSAADYGAGATASASFTDVAVSSVASGDPSMPSLRAAETLTFGVDPVYPNPVTGRAAVRVYLAEAGPVAIAVFDLLGRRVVDQRIEAAAGVVDLGIDLGGVPSGSYVLQVEATGEVETQRFTVVR